MIAHVCMLLYFKAHIVEFGVIVVAVSTVGDLPIDVPGVENSLGVPARGHKHHSAVASSLCRGFQQWQQFQGEQEVTEVVHLGGRECHQCIVTHV